MEKTIASGVLAFVGDSAYELWIREKLVKDNIVDSDKLHYKTIDYVRAESQAYAIKKLMEGFLLEEEIEIVKKARNHKMPNRSRSAGMVEYKLATGLEALVGSLYLDGNKARLDEVMDEVVKAIQEKIENKFDE